MRKDKEKKAPERVTRRTGTRMGSELDFSRTDEREERVRAPRYAYEERYARDDRRSRDDRGYHDDRNDRDDRRYRDERDDRRYRDERDDRRYRDERDDRRYRDERDDRRYRDDRDDRRSRNDRDDRHDRDERDDRRSREERAPREERRQSEKASGRAMTKRPEKEQAASRGGNPERTVHQLVPYVLFCLSIFAAVSFFLRDIAGLDGETGTFGSFLADFLCGLFGVVAYALPLFMFVLALRWRTYVKKGLLLPKILLSTSFLLLLSAIIHVFQESSATRGVVDTTASVLYGNGMARVGGGFFGGFFGEYLSFIFRLPGTIILAIPLLLILGIYLIGMTPSGLWQRIACKYQLMCEKREARRTEMYDGEEPAPRKQKKEREKPSVTPAAEPEQSEIAVTAWREPRPLEQSGSYVFCDDEDDPIIPPRAQQPKAEPAPQAASTLIEDEEQAPVAPTYTVPATPAPAQVLREIITEQSTPAPAPARAQEAPVQETPAEPAYAGQVYAPFALPVQPFPSQGKPAAATDNTSASSTFTTTTVTHSQATGAQKQEEDEVLGAFAPASRPAVRPAAPSPAEVKPLFDTPTASAPQPAAPVRPAAVKEVPLSFAAPAASAPLEVQEMPAVPQRSTPVAPFASFEEETPDEPTALSDDLYDVPQADEAESPAPVADIYTFEPKPAAEPYASEPEPAAESYAFEVKTAPVAEKPREEAFDTLMQTTVYQDGASVKQQPVAVHVERVESDFTFPPAESITPPPATPVQRVVVHTAPVREEAPEPAPVMREYTRPTLDLLNEDKNVRTEDFYEEIEETKEILRQTMASFNIRIQDEINYSHGPSVTRYEMRPVAGTSVRSVTNRTEDIALNLASSVRIEAPIPGKPAIGIEVPNKVRETVYMRTMLESEQFKKSTDPLDVPLGLDVGGEVRMCNLAKMPHLLVAGTTGSGKSVCINSILVSLIYKTSPADLRLILIDPKQIEFAPYEDVPHLYMPIVTDMQRAAGALACAVQEMERRFSLIKDVGVRNIEAYNEAVRNDPDREHLPYIVIVIDEFADLKMSCNNNDPENFTCRIAQKARAAGIHLIIGTQRPSVDVITGKLKTNIPSRIAFMVKQQVDSRTILDANGAEALTGRGDMLYMPTNSNDKQPVRIQGAFVSDGELERVISFVRRHNDPVQYNRAFMDQIEVEMAKNAKQDRRNDDFDLGDEDEGGEDPKFVEAVELAVQTQKVATSLLQRRLGVGYGRAAKIIDRMEELGLVSPAEGNKPRKLLPAAQGYLEHIGAAEPDDGEYEDDYS